MDPPRARVRRRFNAQRAPVRLSVAGPARREQQRERAEGPHRARALGAGDEQGREEPVGARRRGGRGGRGSEATVPTRERARPPSRGVGSPAPDPLHGDGAVESAPGLRAFVSLLLPPREELLLGLSHGFAPPGVADTATAQVEGRTRHRRPSLCTRMVLGDESSQQSNVWRRHVNNGRPRRRGRRARLVM